MDDEIRAAREQEQAEAAAEVDEAEAAALVHMAEAMALRVVTRHALGLVVVSAGAFALGASATFENAERMTQLREAVNFLGRGVGLQFDWPTDDEGRPVAAPGLVDG